MVAVSIDSWTDMTKYPSHMGTAKAHFSLDSYAFDRDTCCNACLGLMSFTEAMVSKMKRKLFFRGGFVISENKTRI